MTTDEDIHKMINDLVQQQHELREQLSAGEITSVVAKERSKAIEERIDQCWDLLRQRKAQSEFGGNPDTAKVRSVETVTGYLS